MLGILNCQASRQDLTDEAGVGESGRSDVGLANALDLIAILRSARLPSTVKNWCLDHSSFVTALPKRSELHNSVIALDHQMEGGMV